MDAQAGAARLRSSNSTTSRRTGGRGKRTADNIQLRCRAHNQYEARLFFGETLVRERREVWAEHSPSEMTAWVVVSSVAASLSL